MAKVPLKDIQTLRTMTGLGMLDCKKALEESGGDIDKAVEILRKRGVVLAGKRAGKDTTEGIVYSYIHPGDQTGVLVEINIWPSLELSKGQDYIFFKGVIPIK